MPHPLFRALLRLLPEEFRTGYAREMEATFGAERRAARAAGSRAALAGLWLATAADILRNAPREHLDILARDVRVALRAMRARPLHTLSAVLTLALGLGANIAMFAVIDAVLLAPLPYRDPDALVLVAETERGTDPGNMGYLTFTDLRGAARSVSGLTAAGMSSATLTDRGQDAERVNAMRVSSSYFALIGVQPALGRAFTDAEDRPGSARRVLVLSDGLWRRRFQADPAIVGRTIDVGGLPYQVVGVMPRGFDDPVAANFFEGAELWTPLGYDPAASYACRTCRHLRVIGRLAAGVEPAAAEAELTRLFAALERAHPTQYHAAGARVTPLAEIFLGPVRRVLLVLWAGVAALLLVACFNTANLLLMRASERAHEMAVRTALGVTRGRLVRQLLTESGLLALVAGAAGLVLAWVAVRWLAGAGPAELPRLADAAVDARAVAAAGALAALSGLAFGLAPLREIRRGAARALHGAGRRTGTPGTWRIRSALVAVNVALAALLLVGSGLLVRSLTRLLAVAPGFDPHGAITMRIWASGPAYRAGDTSDQIATAVRFYDEVLARTRALPGVAAAAAVSSLPLGGNVDGFGLHVEGRTLANPGEAPTADRFVVTPEYFSTMRIPLLRGRAIGSADRQGGPLVAVVNRTLAAELFAGSDPIGRRIRLGPPTAEPRTIVGVAADVQHHGLDAPAGYQVYVPLAQWAWAETLMTLVVRAPSNPAALAAPVRAAVREIDPAQPVTNVQLYVDVVRASMGARGFAAWLLAAFAATALALAVVGLYGALGVAVGQRRAEIGVRLALGADGTSIRRMVLAQGLRPVAAGLAGGLALAAALAGAVRSLLFDVPMRDPATFTAAAATLLACALAACLVPAGRAARIDPAETLRAEG